MMDANEASVWLAAIAMIGSVTASVLGYLNRRKLETVHHEINSRLTQLVESTRGRAFSEGLAQGSLRPPDAPP